MSLSIDDVKKKKDWVAKKLTFALKDKFNIAGLNVAHGITLNVDGNPDFAIRIYDLDNPNKLVDQAVVKYAEKKIQEWVPESKPNILATKVPKAL